MIPILIVLILLSAFFSSLETALFHLKPHSEVNDSTKRLLKNPKRLLASLLTGNTIVNIGLGSLAASYTLILYNSKFFPENFSLSFVLMLEVVAITVILLIFGEVVTTILSYFLLSMIKLPELSSLIILLTS